MFVYIPSSVTIQLIRSSLSVFSFEHVCLYPHINISIQYPTVREDNAIDRLIINKTRFQFLDLHEILEIIVNIGFQFSLVVLSCLRVSVSRRRWKNKKSVVIISIL